MISINEKNNLDNKNQVGIDLKEIINLYKITELKLEKHGKHIPGENPKLDSEINFDMDHLLTKKESLLNQVGNYEIKSKDEIKLVVSLWEKLTKQESETPHIDQLAASICQYALRA